MDVRRDLFLALTAAMAACHGTRAAPEPRPSSASSPPIDAAALCGGVADENARVLAKATRECPAATEPAGGEKRLAEIAKAPAFRYCHATGGGVWVMQLTSAALQAPSGESGTWCGASAQYVIARVTADGTAEKSEARSYDAFNDSQTDVQILYQYDYDGDGRDELLVRTSSWQNGGGSNATMEVLRASPRGIEPYPIGFHVTNAVDADHDGRPDLLDEDYFHAVAPCGLDGVDLYGPPLLVHALADGKFSMSDEVSRQWAVTQCPSTPTAPFAEPKVAACGRLWGKSAADVSDPALVVNVCGMPDDKTVSALVSPKPPFTPLNQGTPRPLAK